MKRDAINTEPQYASVEALVEYLLYEDECFDFTHEHLTHLRRRLQRSARDLRRELEGYGLALVPRAKPKKFRGIHSSSDHDRWWGPGSSKMHGGTGYEQINGFAGQKG